jgi:integrase
LNQEKQQLLDEATTTLTVKVAESIHAIDYTFLRQWQKDLVKKGVRGKTLWNVTGGLSSFLGWLVRTGVLDRVPPVPWPRYDEHVPQIVRPEVQDRILEAIPETKRGVFLVMALLGLRHSEAWALDGRDYRDGRLWIRKARKGRTLDSPLRGPKNRRPRVLPVPDALADWIEQHVPRKTLLRGGPLFPNPRTGKAWAPTSFRRTWAKACQAAGLPVLKPYETLRHSTATEWMRRGASEREVQELLGHRTRHATPRYARLADERLESIVGRRRRDDD